MNLVLHTAAGLALVALLWGVARLRAQRDFLRALAHAAAGTAPARLQVDEPERFLERFAGAVGIAFEAARGKASTAPARIDAAPLLELFLRSGLVLVRCGGAAIELHVVRRPDPGAAGRLSAALGGVPVTVVETAPKPALGGTA